MKELREDKLTELNLSGLGPTEGIVLAELLKFSVLLKKLNLDGLELDIEQLKGIDPVESLDLSGKRLEVASGIVIAKCLEFNAVLTSLE